MNNQLVLSNYGVSEISRNEAVETDGGIFPLLVIAGVALIASSCTYKSNNNEQNGFSNNYSNGNTTVKVDSNYVNVGAGGNELNLKP